MTFLSVMKFYRFFQPNLCTVLFTKQNPKCLSIDSPLITSCLQFCNGYCSSQKRFHFSVPVRAQTACEILTERFTDKGIAPPESKISAESIVAHVIGKKKLDNETKDVIIAEEKLALANKLVQLREKRMPLQYVLGEWDFHEFTLEMKPPVFIPRPETEELVNHILKDMKRKGCSKFLEIGCGSGSNTLFLLSRVPKTRAISCDISPHACSLTKRNLELYNIDNRATVLELDFKKEDSLSLLMEYGPYDFVICNPPYIPSTEIDTLEPEVRCYEDGLALDGGEDGMDFIRYLLNVAPTFFHDDTMMYLEVGLGQTKKIETVVKNKHSDTLKYIETIKDFTQRERFCVLGKSESLTR